MSEKPPAKRRNYTFVDIPACNMCGTDTQKARLLGMRLDRSLGRSARRGHGVAVSVYRCRECGLVFTNPLPVPRSISDHYDVPPESYWNSVSYDVEPGRFAWQVETAKRLIGFREGAKAIDVGIGLGKNARVLRQAGFDVYGFEPSKPFYLKAMEILGQDDDRFKLGSIETAEFPPGVFDFVTFGAVVEHLYDPSAALTKALTWLKPGGIIHAEIPNANHFIPRIINSYYRASGTMFVTNTSPMYTPYHLYEFTVESFRCNGARNGFRVAEHVVEVASIYNIPKIFHPALRALMARTETGMQLTVWLRKDGP